MKTLAEILNPSDIYIRDLEKIIEEKLSIVTSVREAEPHLEKVCTARRMIEEVRRLKKASNPGRRTLIVAEGLMLEIQDFINMSETVKQPRGREGFMDQLRAELEVRSVEIEKLILDSTQVLIDCVELKKVSLILVTPFHEGMKRLSTNLEAVRTALYHIHDPEFTEKVTYTHLLSTLVLIEETISANHELSVLVDKQKALND